jgi:hypothetical protein
LRSTRQAHALAMTRTSCFSPSRCDLLIAGILRGSEDYAEMPPTDEDAAGEAARSLLRWALTGQVPDKYNPYVPTAGS